MLISVHGWRNWRDDLVSVLASMRIQVPIPKTHVKKARCTGAFHDSVCVGWITRACKVARPAELVDSGFSQKHRLKAEEQLRTDDASTHTEI